MIRLSQIPRKDWRMRLESLDFDFHSIDKNGNDVSSTFPDKFAYWREDVAYQFTLSQIDLIEDVTDELWGMCMDTVSDLITRGDLARLRLPLRIIDAIYALPVTGVMEDWLYARFDLAYDGVSSPKMLEINPDTPTSLIESAVAQWRWKEEVQPQADQFNSLHEALVERIKFLIPKEEIFYVSGDFLSLEEAGNLRYLGHAGMCADRRVELISLEDIGRLEGNFVDLEDRPIKYIFKLYPWEHFAEDEFMEHVPVSTTRWIEPVWKAAMSNKAILALLWERFPGHPNLLAASFSAEKLPSNSFVKKPIFSREGANIQVVQAGQELLATTGEYGKEGHIFQDLYQMPSFKSPETTSMTPSEKVYPVIGSWVVGTKGRSGKAVGMCVREDLTSVTSNTAYFVPHFIS